MDLNITSNKENKTIGRKEIEFSVFTDSGVKRDALKAELCKKLNISPASTIVVRIDSGFGSKMSTGIAHSYASEDDLKRYESRRLLERLGVVQKQEKKAAAPAAAKPAEEKK
jgi:ribosomal protein S24E